MNGIQIRYADDSNLPYLIQNDSLVTEEIIKKKISDRQVIVCMKGEAHLGCMRFGFGWDMFPFLNFIIVEKDLSHCPLTNPQFSCIMLLLNRKQEGDRYVSKADPSMSMSELSAAGRSSRQATAPSNELAAQPAG